MLVLLLKILGALGLIVITWGIFEKNIRHRDRIYVIGGSALLIYSIYLKDPIFIPLQIIFTLASLYHIYTLKKKRYIFF